MLDLSWNRRITAWLRLGAPLGLTPAPLSRAASRHFWKIPVDGDPFCPACNAAGFGTASPTCCGRAELCQLGAAQHEARSSSVGLTEKNLEQKAGVKQQ